MKYIVQSDYVDKFICFSQQECNYYSEIFDASKDKFQFCCLGIEPIQVQDVKQSEEKTILACGRSNRDYDFLYRTLKDTKYKVTIISDECKLKPTNNISIYTNVYNQRYFDMLAKSYIVVIPLMQKNISSGQLVMLQAMQLGKPIICTESNTVKDYIQDGINGYIIKKQKNDLLQAIEKLYQDETEYNKMSKNEKQFFEDHYSIHAFGKQVGKIFNKFCKD